MINDRIKISKIAVVEDGRRKLSNTFKGSRMPCKIISLTSNDIPAIKSRLLVFVPDVVVVDTDSRRDNREISEILSKTLFATHKRFLILAVGKRSRVCHADLFLQPQSNMNLALHLEKAIRISEFIADDLAIYVPPLSREKIKSSINLALSRCLNSVKNRRRSFR